MIWHIGCITMIEGRHESDWGCVAYLSVPVRLCTSSVCGEAVHYLSMLVRLCTTSACWWGCALPQRAGEAVNYLSVPVRLCTSSVCGEAVYYLNMLVRPCTTSACRWGGWRRRWPTSGRGRACSSACRSSVTGPPADRRACGHRRTPRRGPSRPALARLSSGAGWRLCGARSARRVRRRRPTRSAGGAAGARRRRRRPCTGRPDRRAAPVRSPPARGRHRRRRAAWRWSASRRRRHRRAAAGRATRPDAADAPVLPPGCRCENRRRSAAGSAPRSRAPGRRRRRPPPHGRRRPTSDATPPRWTGQSDRQRCGTPPPWGQSACPPTTRQPNIRHQRYFHATALQNKKRTQRHAKSFRLLICQKLSYLK